MSNTAKIAHDVVISCQEADLELVKRISAEIDKTGVHSWYQDKRKEDEIAEKLLACKVFIIILSESSAADPKIQDEVALAYVSNKMIMPIGRKYFRKIAANLNAGMKLMLAKINWIFFVKDEDFQQNITQLLEVLGAHIARYDQTEPDTGSTLYLDVNNAIQAESDDEALSKTPEIGEDFWQRHFTDLNQAEWTEFRKHFLKDYGNRIKESFGADLLPKFTQTLEKDIFSERKMITHSEYLEFIGDNVNNDNEFFYKRLQNYVVGYLAMREVFDMQSSVRLTAIQSLGAFQTETVVRTLFELIEDNDPNIRAVAALALAKTGSKNEKIADHLIRLMKDEDRLVRESACLSLGHMRCERAVDGIVDLWRNDAIKHVREAAEIALSKLEGEEAEKAIHMTRVLSIEMEKLRNAPKS